MDSQKDRIREATIRKAIHKAGRELKKQMENEPGLVIESGAEETGLDSSAKSEIVGWLFSRKER